MGNLSHLPGGSRGVGDLAAAVLVLRDLCTEREAAHRAAAKLADAEQLHELGQLRAVEQLEVVRQQQHGRWHVRILAADVRAAPLVAHMLVQLHTSIQIQFQI